MFTNLLTNMIVIGSHGVYTAFHPTNEISFHRYAKTMMVECATNVAAKMNWDISVMTRSNITGFYLVPTLKGISGSLEFSHRYFFGFSHGALDSCADTACFGILFYPGISGSDETAETEESRQTRKIVLSAKPLELSRAVAIGKQVVANLHLDLAGFGMTNFSAHINEYIEQDDYGVSVHHSLPSANLQWQADSPKSSGLRATLLATLHYDLKMFVSGISGNVVLLQNYSPLLRLPMPTNYLEMLGVPTNAIFVYRYGYSAEGKNDHVYYELMSDADNRPRPPEITPTRRFPRQKSNF